MSAYSMYRAKISAVSAPASRLIMAAQQIPMFFHKFVRDMVVTP